MIAETGIFGQELMSKSPNESSHPSGSRPREEVVEELLNFSWGSDGRLSHDAMDSSGSSLSCGQELSLSSTLEKSVKLKDPEGLLQAQSFRSYSTSDLLDLGTVIKDVDEDPAVTKRVLSSTSDVRIPEYALDVISEDFSPVSLTRAPQMSCRPTSSRNGRTGVNIGETENANENVNHTMQRQEVNLGMRSDFQNAAGSNALFARTKVGSQVFSSHKTLAQVSENETLKSELDPDQTLRQQSKCQSPASATDAKAVRRKRFLRRRSSERKPFENVPDFVKEELMTTSGIGHFTMSELMCCLLFAHREALSSNSYANIRAKMGNKRSRVSIRRKIEKIVLSETGLGGGLLGLTGDQNQLVLEAIWNRLMSLISDAETYGTQNLKLFAAQLREYAQNPLKFAVREQRR